MLGDLVQTLLISAGPLHDFLVKRIARQPARLLGVAVWKITRSGSVAALLETERWDPGEAASRVATLERTSGVLAAIPGTKSLYLVLDGEVSDEALRAALACVVEPIRGGVRRVRVAVDPACGPDLERFLSLKSIELSELREILSELELTVRHLGFRPGFAYLDGLPESLHTERLESPRTRVEKGSFAIGGGMAAFYPDASPGGWWLLGRSDEEFWDPGRTPPNLLGVGDTVTLHLVEAAEIRVTASEDGRREGRRIGRVVELAGSMVETCPIPDYGRLRQGESVGGVWDVEAAVAANRAVGNPPEAPILELRGSCSLRFEQQVLASLAGKATAFVENEEVVGVTQFGCEAGGTISISQPEPGRTSVLAIRGGFESARLRRIHRGEELFSLDRRAETPRISRIEREKPMSLRVVEGPSRVGGDLLDRVCSARWERAEPSSRVGIRFRSNARVPVVDGSGSSVGAQPGSIQLTPSGELIVLGPDHPVTGGYPQVLTVLRSDLWKLSAIDLGDSVEIELVRRATCSQIEV